MRLCVLVLILGRLVLYYMNLFFFTLRLEFSGTMIKRNLWSLVRLLILSLNSLYTCFGTYYKSDGKYFGIYGRKFTNPCLLYTRSTVVEFSSVSGRKLYFHSYLSVSLFSFTTTTFEWIIT